MIMVDCHEVAGVPSGAGPSAVVGGPPPPSILREQFAKVCFETLLQFSLVDGITTAPSTSTPPCTETVQTQADLSDIGSATDAVLVTGKLAVTALLHRFQEVVEKFCHDQNLTGKCPLPRLTVFAIVPPTHPPAFKYPSC